MGCGSFVGVFFWIIVDDSLGVCWVIFVGDLFVIFSEFSSDFVNSCVFCFVRVFLVTWDGFSRICG